MNQDSLFNKFFAKVTEVFNNLIDINYSLAFETIAVVLLKIIIVIIAKELRMKP